MLRVVLCIICLHPFLWVFLFALLYHTVKDFFMLILLKTCEFCIFWTVYRFRGGGAQKKAAAGRFTAAFCGLFFPGNRKRPRWGPLDQ